ncbi:acetylgalactosaminyl-O-glycosyl-glycoprotein beta-1,3-N-acetylglucosaminyltransferase [Drosophila subpulchrella]|uniref:acetylgalactosaminyl-O-glycosyl-glycoprotein beta-1,3-N-acetylglucosaminyltransferase n=1 Tax=Drosophila subpulchrella TaxID=1486046 RepID=UPI0018A18461|nr:acetylgalactosaminyl-O-glycosyl-glycoprotein beta-1,3-N-acetylglucosaminyltransferase [Drosophila subpulchrella]
MAAVGNLHNTRILRFLLVLIVVVLTIFIYATYSTAGGITANRLHSAPSPAQQLIGGHPGRLPMDQVNNTEKEYSPPASGESTAKVSSRQSQQQQQQQQQQPAEIHKKHPQHRLPTIDEDALLDGGSAGASPQVGGAEQTPNAMADELLEEQQYGQSVDGITGNINSSSNNNSSADTLVVKQSIPAQSPQQQQSQAQPVLSDAELLIPTSNLQKFIENADKILKNITTNSSTGNGAAVPATGTDQNTDKGNQPDTAQLNSVDGKLEVSPDSKKQELESKVIQEIKDGKKEAAVPPPKSARPPVPIVKTTKGKSVAKAPIAPVDPSKGVATEKLYEPGHLDEEIDAQRICPRDGEFVKLLVLISSAMSHEAARMSIRQTWMHYGSRRDVGMAFVLGRGTNETLNKALTQENFIYGDLIRGNFIDSYNNLTLKTISTLEWADLHCPKAKYILKTDDDMFINVPKLLTFLDKHKDKRTIYGRLAKKWKPIRNKKSKYYVSVDQFAAGVFPSFTTGPAYVLTGDIVHELYVRSLKTVYLKLEDVFTTGIVAKSLNIKRVQANEFVNRRISFNPCNIRNAISVHMIKSNEQFDLWKKLLDQTTKCK